MKKLILLLCAFGFALSAFSQQSTIDVVGMHQLITQSQDEHTQQVNARNNQATVTANEQANLTLLEKLKNIYRTLQQRYNTLGTAITVADIGIEAEPMVKQIISYQGQIVGLVEKNPVIAFLGVQTEIEFAEKAESLLGYVAGLTLSFGDVNQMKASDRKILFDYVIQQLSQIQELSGNLVNTLTYSNLSTLLRSINPFQNFIDADKSMAESIIQNAKYLKN
jgi:Skp family chaperone for outer membrane proteins